MTDNKGNTFLSRTDSNVLKGVLTLLIVYGHNHILCPNTGDGGMMHYLYMFHVPCFFILPVFYDRQVRLTKRVAGNMVLRCWWPYLWACGLCYLVFSLVNHRFCFGWEHVWAFVQGTQTPLKESFGFVFPWFLPAYCSYSILLFWARQSRRAFALLVGGSFVLWALPYDALYALRNSVPFALTFGVYYIAAGMSAFYLNKWWGGSKYVGALLFVAFSVVWATTESFPYCFRHLMPVAFFLLLLCLLPLLRWRWLEALGKSSLGIYLFNMFFVNATTAVFPHNMLFGVLSFAVSLFVPWGVTLLIDRLGRMRVLVFPRSADELLHMMKHTK